MKMLSIAFAVIAFFTCASIFQNNAPFLLNFIEEMGWLAPVLFLLLYCLATILLLPTMVLTLAGGALFGPVIGTLLNLLGATTGAICAFTISRYVALNWFTAKTDSKLNKLILGVEKKGWQFVALLRLIPIIPFNFVNYGLGITNIKFSHYALTTFVFLMPAEIIYTYCGYLGRGVLTQPTSYYRNTLFFILLIFGLLIFALKSYKKFKLRNITY